MSSSDSHLSESDRCGSNLTFHPAKDGNPANHPISRVDFCTQNKTFASNIRFPLAFCWNGVGTVINSYSFASNVRFPLSFCRNGVETVVNSYRNGWNCV